eukprot:gb/GEZN01000299.1/.p1 GENE.gb/GEZN01000299.1/~~gb/GEZN01000299.1/.p1  ORF type:complete len:1575 (-),score=266.88 gb/GEZN01000299.1/:312-5036(-)
MSSRPKRNATRRGDASVLEKIAAARAGGEGQSRLQQYTTGGEASKDADGIFHTVTEEEYEKIVKDRQAADFVVEDAEGLGYADHGEEEIWGDEEAKKRKEALKGPKIKQLKEPERPQHRVDGMFLGGNRSDIGPGMGGGGFEGEIEGDDDFKSMLSGLDEDNLSSNALNPFARPEKRHKKTTLKDIALFGEREDLDKAEDEPMGGRRAYGQERSRYDEVPQELPSSTFIGDGLESDFPELQGLENDDWQETRPARTSGRSNIGGYAPGMESNFDDDMDTGGYSSGDEDDESKMNPIQLQAKQKRKAFLESLEAKRREEADTRMREEQLDIEDDWGEVRRTAAPEGAEAAVATTTTTTTSSSSTSDTPVPKPLKTKMRAAGDSLQVYYYDAWQEQNHPSRVYVFGKTAAAEEGKWDSCCLVVENVERNVFVLPRKLALMDAEDETSTSDQKVSIADVYQELQSIFNKIGVAKFKCKPVKRKYCFDRLSQFDKLAGLRRKRLGPNLDLMEGEEVEDDPSDVAALQKQFQSLEDPVAGIPAESTWLKVVYPFTNQQLPRGLRGKTFSAVYGTKSNALELFLLKRDLMGPCWVSVTNEQKTTEGALSWCKQEFTVNSPKQLLRTLQPPEAPPLTVMSIALQTIPDPATRRTQVVMCSVITHDKVAVDGPTEDHKAVSHVTAVRKLAGGIFPFDLTAQIKKCNLQGKFQPMPNERALLNWLMAQVHRRDPDVILGHNIVGIDIEVLLARMHALKIGFWSRLGRLNRKNQPNKGSDSSFSMVDRGICAGRLVCDTLESAKELTRQTTYELTHLAKKLLKQNRREVSTASIPDFFKTSADLFELAKLTEQDAWLAFLLMHKLQIIPLTKQLTSLCGNLWARSLRSARAERVEYLLLHKFHRLKYITPEKYTGKERQYRQNELNKIRGLAEEEKKKNGKRRGKPAYEGGLVLEPKKGFYEKIVLLLDFNSLYPSVIQEYNICFTTTPHWKITDPGARAQIPDTSASKGILPKVLMGLLAKRRQVKQLLKSENDVGKKAQYDIRQKALKLVANSMYGCLGFKNSRFYCEPLAALVTGQGREILQRTVELANTLGYPVIYGDTDSIMVYTNTDKLEEVYQIGRTIKKEVNKRFKILEIEVDGVYKHMLLLRKKKYAAITISEVTDPATGKKKLVEQKEVKGLDLVRRDWSTLSKQVSGFVLDCILSSGASRDAAVEKIHTYLEQTRHDILEGKMPTAQFIITKGLTKHPKEYADPKSQPHVKVALELLAEGKTVRVGDYIPYIICEATTGDTGLASRAYHPSQVNKPGSTLKIDFGWYLSDQILPPVARLCGPIEETDAARIADSLGLEGSKFQNMYKSGETVKDDDDELFLSADQDDAEKFKLVEKLQVVCQHCKTGFEFPGVYDFVSAESQKSAHTLCGLICPVPECHGLIKDLIDETHWINGFSNLLTRKIRGHLDKYYQSWLKCSDNSCGKLTRQVLGRCGECPNPSCQGQLQREYTAQMLYIQLMYYQSLFDVSRAENNIKAENKRRLDNPSGALPQLVAKPLSASHSRVMLAVSQHLDKILGASRFHFLWLPDLFTMR